MLTNDTNIDALLFSFAQRSNSIALETRCELANIWTKSFNSLRKQKQSKHFNKFSRCQFKSISVCSHTQKSWDAARITDELHGNEIHAYCVCWILGACNHTIIISVINNRFLPNRMDFNHFLCTTTIQTVTDLLSNFQAPNMRNHERISMLLPPNKRIDWTGTVNYSNLWNFRNRKKCQCFFSPYTGIYFVYHFFSFIIASRIGLSFWIAAPLQQSFWLKCLKQKRKCKQLEKLVRYFQEREKFMKDFKQRCINNNLLYCGAENRERDSEW